MREKEHLVKTIETRLTTTLSTIEKNLKLHKDKAHDEKEKKRLHAIKKHQDELNKLVQKINSLKSTPSTVKHEYEVTMKKEIHELEKVFESKIKEAEHSYKELEKEVEKI